MRELAKFADVHWDARNSKKTVAAAGQPATLEEETTLGEETALERAVAALTIHNKKKWHDSKSRAGSWSRGGSRGNRRGGQSCQPLCKRHEMYGDGTWHWDYPKHAPGLKTSRPG